MATKCIHGVEVPAALAADEERLRVRVALLQALEASLEGSRKALLALDLSGIERGTSEQMGLIRELDAVAGGAAERPPAGGRCRPMPEIDTSFVGELEQEARRSAQRILEALRLHRALLARAQGKLRVLANMLASPSVPYGDLLARNRGLPQVGLAAEWRT